MQDYAKVLPTEAKIGFTTSATWIGYSPAKNSIAEGRAKIASGVDPMAPASAEADMYAVNANLWRLQGCSIGKPTERVFQDIPVKLGPLMSISPFFAPTRAALAAALPSPGGVIVTSRSALVISGPGRVIIESLDLDGALVIEAVEGSVTTIRGLRVHNDSWEIVADEVAESEVLRIRGFRLVKHATEVIALAPGKFSVSSASYRIEGFFQGF